MGEQALVMRFEVQSPTARRPTRLALPSAAAERGVSGCSPASNTRPGSRSTMGARLVNQVLGPWHPVREPGTSPKPCSCFVVTLNNRFNTIFRPMYWRLSLPGRPLSSSVLRPPRQAVTTVPAEALCAPDLREHRIGEVYRCKAWLRISSRLLRIPQRMPASRVICKYRSQMRYCRCLAIIAAEMTVHIATSGIVRAECDPAKPTEFAQRFEVHGNTVYDKSTNLTWTRCSYGQQWTESSVCSGVVELLDWNTAVGLIWQGDQRWRLPNRDELQSIVATTCKKPAIDQRVFPGTPSIQYWTSTASGPSYAWVVFFRTGMPTWNFLKTTPFAVRLVRSGR